MKKDNEIDRKKKRSETLKNDSGEKTTRGWKECQDMIKPCKYCKKTPTVSFDHDQEKYKLECCEDYKPVYFEYLRDSINHHIGFKKSLKNVVIDKVKGVFSS